MMNRLSSEERKRMADWLTAEGRALAKLAKTEDGETARLALACKRLARYVKQKEDVRG